MNAVLACCRSINSLKSRTLDSSTTRLNPAMRLLSWLAVFIFFSTSNPCSAQTILPTPTSPAPQSTEASAAIDITKGLTVSPPVTHKNLSVYFLHRQDRDDREFLMLNEGLKSGLVTVTEQKQEQVNQLVIDNKSDKPLFLQEGDRVTGGKQDRTIYSSLVVKAKSGPMPIPTFCVEQSRWQAGSLGKNFSANANQAFASNAVRKASKLSKSQGQVWDEVGKTKTLLQKAVGNSNKTSSLNEALDSKQAIDSTKAYVTALGKAADQHKDLVGVAFAIDGQIMEITMYPGCPLVKSVYPRLLETYALDAVVDQKNTKSKPAQVSAVPEKEKVLELMKASATKKVRAESINLSNSLNIDALVGESPDNRLRLFRCETDFEKARVHTQWMFSQPVPAGRAQSNLPFNINDFNNDLNANNFNNNDVLPNFAPQRQQHTLPIIPPQPIPLQQAPPTKNAPER